MCVFRPPLYIESREKDNIFWKERGTCWVVLTLIPRVFGPGRKTLRDTMADCVLSAENREAM